LGRNAKRLFAATLLGLAGLAPACRKEEPPPPPPYVLPDVTTADLFVMTRAADLVVSAEVVAVGPPARHFADPPLFQNVTYRAIEVFTGEAPEGVFLVRHPIIRARPFVHDASAGLAEDYFHPGARFILYLRKDGDYVVLDDRDGVMVLDDATVEEVRDAVAAHTGGGRRGDPFSGRRRR
jgi:hypothetical protein